MSGLDDGADAAHDHTDAFVAFQLGPEGYALEVARVREVLDAAALPRARGGLPRRVGLHKLRGHVVPVWDRRIPFGLSGDGPPARAPNVLMVEPDPGQPSRVAGLLVDRVSDVLDIPPGEVQPAPTIG